MGAKPISRRSPESGTADFGHTQRLAVELVHESPALDDQAQTADARRCPEDALRRDSAETRGHFLEPRTRFLEDGVWRLVQRGLLYEDPMRHGRRPPHLNATGVAPRVRKT